MIRILVIDDEPDFSDIILKYYTRLGCDVAVAASGTEGVFRMKELAPDIVVVDNNLPDMRGTDLVRAFREVRPDLLMLMVTVDKVEDVMASLGSLRVDRYLKKPFRFDELNDAMIQLISDVKRRKKGQLL